MRKKNESWYRHIKTTAERRANSDPEHKKYVRSKRNINNLPHAYDDISSCSTKCWKDKRLKQYRTNGRGPKHTYSLDMYCCYIYGLEEYFRDHNIPFCIEPLYKVTEYVKTHERKYCEMGGSWKQIVHKIEPKGNNLLTSYKSEVYWKVEMRWVSIPLAEPKVCYHKHCIGYDINWWSHKDIGIEYLINEFVKKGKVWL